MRCLSNFMFLLSFLTIGLSTEVSAQDSIAWQTLDEVVFVAKKIYTPSSLTINNRDFKRLAASFDDPTRILMHYPGFSNANDQANGIIYHGLPSHFSGWQLNGLDIVNPNHLSNAGTFSDRSSLSAGGVNMFSGNLINAYQYNSTLNSKMNGAALAGISNLNIDSLERSYAQLSLLGLEIGLTKKIGKHHSFFGSYRYSFTGLLGKLGVNFGNEEIAFSDGLLAYLYKNKNTSLNLFFSRGISSNLHTKNDEGILSYKDLLLIDYSSDINIYQFQFNQKISNAVTLQFSVAYSEKNDLRLSNGIIDTLNFDNIEVNEHDGINDDKLTLKQNVSFKNGMEIGLKEIRSTSFFSYSLDNNSEGYGKYSQRWAILPYLNKNIKITDQFDLELNASGISDLSFYFTPCVIIKYTTGKNNIIKLSNGKSAQSLYPFNDFKYTTSLNSELSYQYFGEKYTLQTGVFYHRLEYIPASLDYYSLVNQVNLQNFPVASASEEAYTRGLYLSFEPVFQKGYWLNANATFFSAKYKNKESNEFLNIESNYKVIANLNVGKKIKFKTSELLLSSSLHFRGGANQHMPILSVIPAQLDYSTAPSIRLGEYKRLDVRINYIKGKSFWSLDIQNVMNILNDAYQYYDIDGLKTQKQLGMIPVLTYKYSL